VEFTVDGGFAALRDLGLHAGRTLAEPSLRWRDHRAAWDPALVAGLGALGALGVGTTALEAVAVLEGLGAAGDVGLALAVGAHGVLCGALIAEFGTPEHRRHLPVMARGERVAAISPSEVDGEPSSVTAVHSGRSWRLDGTRARVVNAPAADLFLVTAMTADGARTAFLLDRDLPGLEVLPVRDPVALRTRPVGDLVLTGCAVADDAVLGTPGRATTELVPLLAALDRTCLLAPWLGLLRALADRVAETDLAWSQSVRLAVVDVRTSAELAADLLYRAAWELGTPGGTSRRNPALAALFLADAVAKAARLAAELHPADHAVARAHRDSAALTAADREVLRSVVAESLLALGG
jgi:alkylation response protein AidB-like acyl-CoA dehydrogenase